MKLGAIALALFCLHRLLSRPPMSDLMRWHLELCK